MNLTTTKNAIVAAALTGMALCLAAIYYSGERMGEDLQGPSKISRAPDGAIWVVSHGKLHRFSALGARKQVIALSAVGLGPILSEILALSDGTLVVAEAVPSAAYRCDVAALQCTSVTGGIKAAVGPTAHALMIAADEKRRRFYLSDNANHRLILLDFDGNVLDVTAPRRVIYPNELAVEESGRLVVVDTNHHRLVRISVERDSFGPDLWEMRTDSGNLYRLGRIWPMDLARAPRGEWWVLNARDGMKHADLLLFGSDGKALKRVDLGEASDPTQIAVISDGLLVADPTRASLTRVAPDGTVTGPWGDAAFQAELGDLREARSLWSAIRLAAQVLLVVFPLVAIPLLWRLGERLPRWPRLVPAGAPTPVEGGLHWLEVRPEFTRSARRMTVAVLAVIWTLSIAMLLLAGSTLKSLPKPVLVLALAMFAACMLVPLAILFRAPAAWRVRLGTDGHRFFLDPGNGKVEEHPFNALVTINGRQLLVGRRLVTLHLVPGLLFAEEDLRGYIFARIPASGRLGHFEFFLRALDQGNREFWWVVIVLAIGGVLFALPVLVPGMAEYFKAIVSQFLDAR